MGTGEKLQNFNKHNYSDVVAPKKMGVCLGEDVYVKVPTPYGPNV